MSMSRVNFIASKLQSAVPANIVTTAKTLFKYHVHTIEHADAVIAGVQAHNALNTALATRYFEVCTKLGEVAKIQKLIPQLVAEGIKPQHEQHSWDNFIVLAMVRKGDVYGALSLLRQIKRTEVHPYACFIVMTALCSGNEGPRRGLEFLEFLRASKIPIEENAYTCLIDAYGKQMMVEDMVNILKMMIDDNVKITTRTYTLIILVYGKLDKLSLCLRLYDRMKKDGITPNGFTYSALFDACGRSRETKKCVELYEAMKKDVPKPESIVYNVLMEALAKGIDLDACLQVRKDMKKAGVELTEHVVSSLFKVLVKHNRYDAVVDLIKEMEDIGMQMRSANLIALITAFGLAEDLGTSYEVFLLMKNAQYPHLDVAYNCLMIPYSVRGDVDRCAELVQMMQADGINPTSATVSTLKRAKKMSSNELNYAEPTEEAKLGGEKILQALRDHEVYKTKNWNVKDSWINILKSLQ